MSTEMQAGDHSAPETSVMLDEARTLPYRWGYFQGVALIPWSLVSLLAAIGFLERPLGEPLPYALVTAAMGILGFPLAFGLLLKKKFALPLVYSMFGLSLLLTAIQVSIATAHASDHGFRGSAIFEAEILIVWLLSLVYYRRRRNEFR